MGRSDLAAGVTRTRERPVLSRDLIADTAMRLTLEQPTTTLTLARLGQELDADPTALYRHYRSRDELILDLGDRLMRECVERCQIEGDWQRSLIDVASTTRLVYLTRPALAAEVATRFTGGEGEQAAARLTIEIMQRAGFSDAAAIAHTRAFGELLLGLIVASASYLSLPATTREADRVIERRLYPLDTLESPDGAGDAFNLVLATYLAGLRHELAVTTFENH